MSGHGRRRPDAGKLERHERPARAIGCGLANRTAAFYARQVQIDPLSIGVAADGWACFNGPPRRIRQAGHGGTRNASTKKSISARTFGVRCLRLGYTA